MKTILLTLLVTACTTARPQQTTQDVMSAKPSGKVWYTGSMTEAFAESKATGKPLLIYWGAQWCPPCHALKANVFTQNRFRELADRVIPVYLDGDTTAAQTWGDQLSASGYPTVMILNANQVEMMRVESALSMEEFETAMSAALQSNAPFDVILKRTLAGNAKQSDWIVLANASWGQLKDPENPTSLLQARLQLIERIPSHLETEKTMLIASVLRELSTTKDDKKSPIAKAQAKNAASWIKRLTSTPEGRRVGRSTLVFYTDSLIQWGWENPKSPEAKAITEDILVAVEKISRDHSEDSSIYAAFDYPAIVVHRMQNPKKPVPQTLKNRLSARVEKALSAQDPKSSKRKTAVSDAAWIYREAGMYGAARELLIKEAKISPTPWYYYASLSSLENKLGNSAKALEWSAAATASAKGQATRVQWTIRDLLLTQKLKEAEKEQRLLNLTRQLYDLVTTLPDGFSGRNLRGMERVANKMSETYSQEPFAKLVQSYSNRCNQLAEPNKGRCQQHFDKAVKL